MKSCITFREMTEKEFDTYYIDAIKSYADDLIKCGASTSDNALMRSKNDFNQALPSGFFTLKAHFHVLINDKNDEAGLIWYIELPDDIAYIGDFLILEQFRRKGYGFQALSLLVEELIENKFRAVALNVFDFNIGARALYEKMGFMETLTEQGCVQMVKTLLSQP